MRPNPTDQERSGPPRHLVVKLRAGWRIDLPEGRFVGPAPGDIADVRDLLPEGCRWDPMIPDLHAVNPASLSVDERNLGRYVHLTPPAGTRPDTLLVLVRRWPWVREARLPPEVSLPAPGAPGL